ncbi:Citrate lyase subunit beta-like protein [Corynebacterium occultum]|uniref:Citrate lyase subunit beta-like protein n=1 Tax=Corynebacterium occultum TaxID=2675219 RepID=A0A6B8VXV4_9CORY|nr:CoA ester lyase [Corynebacterium occultum]QGU06174.1 Citrate lyase subunit beta-like protein [Corynebacterium occultum]
MDSILFGHTALFCPADRPDRSAKALASNAEIIILDLEDAVAPDAKSQARNSLGTLLSNAQERTGIVIRVNDPATETGQADLAELARLSTSPDLPEFTVMVPKLTTDTPLDSLPGENGIIGLIETARGVRDLHTIAPHPRIRRLSLGAVDLSTELGCEPDSSTIDAVRAQLVIASSAAGLPSPLDSPCLDFRNSEIIERAAQRARRDGFGGMLCIHPVQLAPVTAAFLPTREEVEWARQVVAVGDAVTSLNGQMVDRPVILRAQRILGTTRH